MSRLLVAFLLLFTTPTWAKGEKPGDFEFYILSLSWTPSWCALEGDARNSEQCDIDQGFGFTLHGLWPQSFSGWPSYCKTAERFPSRRMTREMSDIMGSAGLAFHQWKKHGVCSGLGAAGYYELSRAAYEKINRPEVFRKLTSEIDLPASVVKDAFLETNPDMTRNGIKVTCKKGAIQEVRICLSKDLEFQTCGDYKKECSLQDADMAPIR